VADLEKELHSVATNMSVVLNTVQRLESFFQTEYVFWKLDLVQPTDVPNPMDLSITQATLYTASLS
jgi:hypothetical protein